MDEKRDRHLIRISLNTEEYALLESWAKESSKGLSTWVKDQIFDGSHKAALNNQAEILQRFYVLSHMFIWVFQSLAPNIINEKAVNELIEDSKKKYPTLK